MEDGERLEARFVVDAARPGLLLVTVSPLELVGDEEGVYRLDTMSAQVHRQALPAGVAACAVTVPLPTEGPYEVAVLGAAGEALALSHQKARGRYRWTVGRAGLEPFLGPGDTDFHLPYRVDVASAAWLGPSGGAR